MAVPRFVNKSPDFSAQMYTDGEGNFRFSMRGSETSNYGGDFRTADAALMLGRWDAQLADGIRFVSEAILQIKESNPDARRDAIRATLDGSGHSLGGAIYEAAAAFWGLRGMNIDGPGVAKQIVSPEFQAIKEEFRSRGLSDLRDSYEWQQGDFQARRYTVVGAAETHAGGVEVYTSPRMGALIDDMNTTPSWAYAVGAGSKYAWETVASVSGHPMAAIFTTEGYGNVAAALDHQRMLANVARGLSASGYEEGSVHYEALGTPVVVGAGSTASTRQDALQIAPFGGTADVLRDLRSKVFAGRKLHQLVSMEAGDSKVIIWPEANTSE